MSKIQPCQIYLEVGKSATYCFVCLKHDCHTHLKKRRWSLLHGPNVTNFVKIRTGKGSALVVQLWVGLIGDLECPRLGLKKCPFLICCTGCLIVGYSYLTACQENKETKHMEC